MRVPGLMLCFLLIPLVFLDGQQVEDRDPYSIGFVKFELQMRSGGRKVIHGFSQEGLSRLGDGVSIAILKILDDHSLTTPETVRDFLPLIRDAFTAPDRISVAVDRNPRVTLFLLNYLQQKVSDTQTLQDIQQSVEFVKAKTGV